MRWKGLGKWKLGMKYGTLREAAGISLVLGVRLSGELTGENKVGCRRERRGVGGCMKNADGDGFTVEARAWTGSVARDEECCIAGAGGGSAGDGLNKAPGGGGLGIGQLTNAGGGVLERAPGGWGGGKGRCVGAGGGVWWTGQRAGAGSGCSIWVQV